LRPREEQQQAEHDLDMLVTMKSVLTSRSVPIVRDAIGGCCRADATFENEASCERAEGVAVIAASGLAKPYLRTAIAHGTSAFAGAGLARGRSVLVTTG
jgi:hypothetical protein